MKYLLTITLIFSFVISFSSYAKENSRPNALGGDYIVEIVSGAVFEDKEEVFEIGLDFERFIDGTKHHFSIGLASELEFAEFENEYFFGILFSGYYHHFKFFLTPGILTNFNGSDAFKTRLGVGYEIAWLKHWLIVPSIAVDYLEGDFLPALTVGLACEF